MCYSFGDGDERDDYDGLNFNDNNLKNIKNIQYQKDVSGNIYPCWGLLFGDKKWA